MNIILVSDSLAKSRIVTITQTQIVCAALGLLVAGFVLALGTYFLTMNYAVDLKNPTLRSLFAKLHQKEMQQAEADMRDNLNAMAVKLGEIQARVMRLDAFGERLAKAAGIKPTEFRFSETPPQGGAIPSAELQRDLSAVELKDRLTELSRVLDDRSDKLGVLDSLLMEGRLAQKAIPTVLPVDQGYYSSNFGYRIDPFNGRNVFHTGVDFVAPPGTAVYAAAGGVVSAAEQHSEYGHMVDVDHDNGLTTRYAHLSKYKAKVGDVVLKGQLIGEVGSSGRATGPHLHFEVREKGVPLNPNRFLTFNRAPVNAAAAAPTVPAGAPTAAAIAAKLSAQAAQPQAVQVRAVQAPAVQPVAQPAAIPSQTQGQPPAQK
jgi:murein DD-endopeptidase MepM/ murein hydrolase activator NlpD